MAADRMNTLFLMSDEHNPWVMGFLGHPCVRTPNLDRLAARGTTFTRAWAASPLCVPSRASIATGRYVHQHQCWDNAIAYPGNPRSWMHALSRAGHVVDAIGKLHFRSAGDPVGFRQQIETVHIQDGIGQVWGSVRDPLPSTSSRSGMFDKLGAGESAYNRYDRFVRDAACHWLESHAGGDAPWTLFVGLVAPHFPLVVPPSFLERVLNDPGLEACLPVDPPPRHHPWVARMLSYMDHDAALGTAERRRLAVAAYLALVEFMDGLVGDILAALEKSGMADTTRVIYTSDHGDNLGARRLWNKGTMYRESAGVPLILAGPDIPAGRMCTTNVSLVDLHPTLLAAQGLRCVDPGLPGRSLLDIACEADDPARIAFSEYHGVGSPTGAYLVANGRYVYHHYVGYPPELFDAVNDPREQHDLSDDPAHAAALAQMVAALNDIVDPGRADAAAKRDQRRLVAAHGGPEQALRSGHRGATGVPGGASSSNSLPSILSEPTS